MQSSKFGAGKPVCIVCKVTGTHATVKIEFYRGKAIIESGSKATFKKGETSTTGAEITLTLSGVTKAENITCGVTSGKYPDSGRQDKTHLIKPHGNYIVPQ